MNKLLLFFILLIGNGHIYSQSFVAKYKKSLNTDIAGLSVLADKEISKFKNLADYYSLTYDYDNHMSKFEFLYFDNGGSDFTYSNVMNIVVYKNHKNLENHYIDEKNGAKTGYKFDMLSLNDWVISKEIELINGYRCYKATHNVGNSLVTAYFTEEINYNDGPEIICGLPGLIVKAISGTALYELVQFKNVEVLENIRLPENAKIIEKSEFEKYRSKKLSNSF